MFAVIGGSGLAKLAGLTNSRRQVARTPWGDPSCALTIGELDGVELVFLARHGYGHTLAPHRINYRANIWALKEMGVSGIISVATVGGIRDDCGPGTIVIPDQLIDYTYDRNNTYFDSPDEPVTHIDFTEPYDSGMRSRFAAAAAAAGESFIDGGTYGCTQGPRLETAAEIERMKRDGCDLVGMTGMPEAALAREQAVPYATLAVVANHAAGLGDSRKAISLDAIGPILDQTMGRVRTIIAAVCKTA
ncbi:MAG: S-methyl-5'-thioinosine phosphorylase [Burkholderiaceae bacterium]